MEDLWMQRTILSLAGAIALIGFTAGQVAFAADAPVAVRTTAPSSDWTLTVGAEGRWMPAFDGASRMVVRPFPVFSFRRVGTPERFLSPRDGIGIGLIEFGGWHLGPVGQLRLPRRVSDDPVGLAGLDNVDVAVELGVFAEYWWTRWLRTRGEVRQGIGGHNGIVADFAADAVVPVSSQITLSGGPRVTLASANALSPYFGITPAQALASGLPAYNVGGGVRSVGAGAQVRYKWTPQLATYLFVEYDRLLNDAASSPLVTLRGSADQTQVGVGMTYSFDVRGLW